MRHSNFSSFSLLIVRILKVNAEIFFPPLSTLGAVIALNNEPFSSGGWPFYSSVKLKSFPRRGRLCSERVYRGGGGSVRGSSPEDRAHPSPAPGLRLAVPRGNRSGPGRRIACASPVFCAGISAAPRPGERRAPGAGRRVIQDLPGPRG